MARLLIIDDEKMICQEFCATMTDLGHDADYATSGAEGLKKIQNNSYQLVFLDLSMPSLNGAAVYKRIRQIRDDVPVAFMAGFMSPQTENEVMKLGALRCLRKPVDLTEITDILESIDRFHPHSN